VTVTTSLSPGGEVPPARSSLPVQPLGFLMRPLLNGGTLGGRQMSLAYDQAYHLHCKLTLATGREIVLTRLRQQHTYAGLLEGYPDSDMNDREIEATLADARSWCFEGAHPLLIPPARRDFLRVPGDMASPRSRRRTPEWLPMVSSIATFRSSPARDRAMHGSTLTMAWFQAEFGPPVSQDIVSAIAALDWDAHASDFEW
jgi:hypothetical protein